VSCRKFSFKNLENTEVAIKIGYSEKLATYGTQDEEKQNKNTTQYVSDTTIRKQILNE
jgi:hypothetical protein